MMPLTQKVDDAQPEPDQCGQHFHKPRPMAQDFTFTALTPDMLEMCQELENMGGGDSRVGQMEVHVRIGPSLPGEAGEDILHPGEGDDETIAVR